MFSNVYCVGRDRFGWDIEMMTGQPPPKLIKILWAFVVPALLVVSVC